jgi:hypothetical protein
MVIVFDFALPLTSIALKIGIDSDTGTLAPRGIVGAYYEDSYS